MKDFAGRVGPDAKPIDVVARLPAGLHQRATVLGAKARRRGLARRRGQQP
jgi:hypothetical protein